MANMNITKRVIREAFVELLNERALSKITVKDITDRCGINRNTFYYHYQDVPALVEEICSIQVDRNRITRRLTPLTAVSRRR